MDMDVQVHPTLGPGSPSVLQITQLMYQSVHVKWYYFENDKQLLLSALETRM